MDTSYTRAQLLEHFLSFFMPEGILDFFELVWAESQSLYSRESKKDIFGTLHMYLDERDNRPRNFAGEPLFLELDEFIFELDLVHRTIVGLFCVLFHAAKLRHEDAIMRQQQYTEVYRWKINSIRAAFRPP